MAQPKSGDGIDGLAIAMGLAFAFIWSSAFTSARVIVAHAPPLTSLSLRFLISGLIAIAIARALGQSWTLTKPQWRATFVFGLCQNAIYLGFNFVAMQTVQASLASIIASIMPLLVALFGWAFLRDRLSPLAILGLCLGCAGVMVIMAGRVSGSFDLIGILYCFLGVTALTIATMVMRGASSGGNLLMVVGLQMLVGSVVLALVAAMTESWFLVPDWQLAVAFSYTVLFPGIVATWIWFTLVARIGAVRAASFHFLNPFFGVAIAAIVLGEALGVMDLIGVIVITLGIVLVQRSKHTHTRM